MNIDKDISKYIVFSEDSLLNALKKISDNQSRIIFSVTETGKIEGVLTDGDFRRWLIHQDSIDLDISVSNVSNKVFRFAKYGDDPSNYQSYFSDDVKFIPLLDNSDHLVAIATQKSDEIKIGNFTINASSPAFIIAEIGNNHNGSLALAKQLIDEAVASGANCAKFQMRHMQSLYQNSGNANDASQDLGSQYTLDLLSRFQLSNEEMFSAFDYCVVRGIIPLCTAWDIESLALLENYGMLAYKVASADFTNHDFLKALCKTNKPLICSTGMSTEVEIQESVKLLQQTGSPYILLHCNSTYPAPFKDINLNYLDRLKKIGNCPVGYSGHERGIHIAISSIAKGAKVIEKHFTLDKSMEGNDHKVSLLPQEFQAMVEGIRQLEQALGTSTERKVSQGEMLNREVLAKSLVINCDLKIGGVITADMIGIKSPGKGLQPNHKPQLVGTTARRNFKAGDFFFPSDLFHDPVQARDYNFNRAWGLPVRYHDFKNLLAKSNPDLLEFHLSYKDLEQDINQYFEEVYDLDLVVHSPELFSGDHVLDLCSDNEQYRQHSIKELQNVIEVTRSLKPFFRKASKPYIVTNVGGFTTDLPLAYTERQGLLDRLIDSLSQLDQTGVEIIPQTMPPFPWHFGGQRYHNLFVDLKDIVEFCRQYNYRICLDISHSALACNHSHNSFKEFLDLVCPYTVHLHIADAEGSDGEGLQIGKGQIDFPVLIDKLNTLAPKASFIPEIWQGHKNEGEGFWIALEKLEDYFKV